jgi:hypothetical protein
MGFGGISAPSRPDYRLNRLDVTAISKAVIHLRKLGPIRTYRKADYV